MKPTYTINYSASAPGRHSWADSYWDDIPALSINHFREESSAHHPVTSAKVTYTRDRLHVLFTVQDHYVKSVHTAYQSMVCRDSCVEVFLRPRQSAGYVNIEVNCSGVVHCSYIEDWARTDGGFKRWTPVPESLGSTIDIDTSIEEPILHEIQEPLTWHVVVTVPFHLFSHFLDDLGAVSGQVWQANFYKCGDDTSHPHWAAWSPVRALNFHDPECFGTLIFE